MKEVAVGPNKTARRVSGQDFVSRCVFISPTIMSHMVGMCFSVFFFLETVTLFFTVIVPYYIPTDKAGVTVSVTSCQHLPLSLSLLQPMLRGA